MHQLILLFVLGLSFYLVLADGEQRNFCDHSTRELDLSEVGGVWHTQKLLGAFQGNPNAHFCSEMRMSNVSNHAGMVNMETAIRDAIRDTYMNISENMNQTGTVGAFLLKEGGYARFVHLSEDGEIFLMCRHMNDSIQNDLTVYSRHPTVDTETIQRALVEAFPGGLQVQELYTRHESCGTREFFADLDARVNYCNHPTRAINVSEVEGDWILQKVAGVFGIRINQHSCVRINFYSIPDNPGMVNTTMIVRALDGELLRDDYYFMQETGKGGEYIHNSRVYSQFVHMSEDSEILAFCTYANETVHISPLLVLSRNPFVEEEAIQRVLNESYQGGAQFPVIYTRQAVCANI